MLDSICFSNHDFVSIVGNSIDNISNSFNNVIDYKSLIKNSNKTLSYELNENELLKMFNDFKDISYNKLNISKKIMYKIIVEYSNKKEIIINNLLSLLDNSDYNKIIKILKRYDNLVINITNNREELLLGNRIIVVNDNRLIIDGQTNEVLKDEKLFRRLGINIPFIMELNNYLKDYELVKKNYSSYSDLVGALWK